MSNCNEEVFCIPQSSSFVGASLSDGLMSYPEHCRDAFSVFYRPSQIGFMGFQREFVYCLKFNLEIYDFKKKEKFNFLKKNNLMNKEDI